MLAICAGVAAAHRIGIVHRDLKPLNIIVRPELPPSEGLKVLDFGLAKIKSGELLGSLVAAQTQGMMGSPFYMAPEQWSDEDIDVRADIYSLGVMLYQMLAGDVPFKGKSIPSIMNMHLNAAPVRLSERGIEVPAPLEQAVQHALEKDPDKRPQTVDDFIAELRAAVPGLNGDAGAVPGVGAATVQISPADLTGSHSDGGAQQTGASIYELQWSRGYPFSPRGSKWTFTTSTVLPLKPGTWYYRVRGYDYGLPTSVAKPTDAPALAWSKPTKIVITAPKFHISGSSRR